MYGKQSNVSALDMYLMSCILKKYHIFQASRANSRSNRRKREWILPPTRLYENVDYTKEEYVAKVSILHYFFIIIHYFILLFFFFFCTQPKDIFCLHWVVFEIWFYWFLKLSSCFKLPYIPLSRVPVKQKLKAFKNILVIFFLYLHTLELKVHSYRAVART